MSAMDDAALLWRAKEKRKWQIALRRYVFKENKAFAYAPYFGIEADGFRSWIAFQFSDGLSWDNFSIKWQFGHVLPMTYFDFTNDADLRLCWNFTNVRVEPLQESLNNGGVNADFKHGDLLRAKLYFGELYARSNNNGLALKMLAKIESIEAGFLFVQDAGFDTLAAFLLEKRAYLQQIDSFDSDAFLKLNEGVALEEILAEQQLMAKFG